jgi:hypothetical protein
MRLTRLFGMMALVSLLAAGCSTTKVAMKRMCESSGGTYAAGTCTPGKAVKAQEMCFAAGGNYNAGEDTCEVAR